MKALEYNVITFSVTELTSEVGSVGSRHDEEQEEPVPETVVVEAAVKIQAAFRGYKV